MPTRRWNFIAWTCVGQLSEEVTLYYQTQVSLQETGSEPPSLGLGPSSSVEATPRTQGSRVAGGGRRKEAKESGLGGGAATVVSEVSARAKSALAGAAAPRRHHHCMRVRWRRDRGDANDAEAAVACFRSATPPACGRLALDMVAPRAIGDPMPDSLIALKRAGVGLPGRPCVRQTGRGGGGACERVAEGLLTRGRGIAEAGASQE